MKSYTIVNPHIGGSMDTTFKTRNVNDAANLAFTSMSKYFSSNIPKFSFTLQKGGGEDFYHFTVTEKIADDKIKFSIQKENKFNNDNLVKFIKENQEHDLKGGKRHSHHKKYKYDEDDSSSSDSDDDYYYYYKPINRYQPINYWSYSPYVYNYRQFYVPTFIPTIVPYISISYL
jgi:hypothetical protein